MKQYKKQTTKKQLRTSSA